MCKELEELKTKILSVPNMIIVLIAIILFIALPSVQGASNATNGTGFEQTTSNWTERANLSLTTTSTGYVFLSASVDGRINSSMYGTKAQGRFLRNGTVLTTVNLTESVYLAPGGFIAAVNLTAGTYLFGFETSAPSNKKYIAYNWSFYVGDNSGSGSGGNGNISSVICNSPLSCSGVDVVTFSIDTSAASFRNDTVSELQTYVNATFIKINDSAYDGTYGDMNEDGDLDFVDAITVNDYVGNYANLFSSCAIQKADIVTDGIINSADVTYINNNVGSIGAAFKCLNPHVSDTNKLNVSFYAGNYPNVTVAGHIGNTSNPHEVTRAQIGQTGVDDWQNQTMNNSCDSAYCIRWNGSTVEAVNGTSGEVEFSGLDGTVLSSVYATTGTTIFMKEGTYTNIPTLDPTGSGDKISIVGEGTSKTILKANTSNAVLFRLLNGSAYRLEALTIDCMGIALCIDLNGSSSQVQRNRFTEVVISNATILIDQSNSEENVYDHTIFGGGTSPADNEYAIVVNSHGGNMRFYSPIFQNSSKSNIRYSASTQISLFSPTFTGGNGYSSTEGQINFPGTGSARMTLVEPWFESGAMNINSSNPNVVLSVHGAGIFNTASSSTQSNINGTYKRLDITGVPTFIAYNSAKNLNIFTTHFNAMTSGSYNTGINSQHGNSSYYSYMIAGNDRIYSNLTGYNNYGLAGYDHGISTTCSSKTAFGTGDVCRNSTTGYGYTYNGSAWVQEVQKKQFEYSSSTILLDNGSNPIAIGQFKGILWNPINGTISAMSLEGLTTGNIDISMMYNLTGTPTYPQDVFVTLTSVPSRNMSVGKAIEYGANLSVYVAYNNGSLNHTNVRWMYWRS